jgi:hypothetical protein
LIVVVAEPTVIVPLRAAPALAATLNATVPLPRPEGTDVIVIQGALLVAVQLHAGPADTVIDPLLAVAAASIVVWLTPNEHGAAA